MEPVTIYKYFDYQKYLRDMYQYRKGLNVGFSYRYIGQKVDIDPGYLVKVFQGKKHIANRSVAKFVTLLNLKKKETEYFELLILFSKAKTNTEIKSYFEKLLAYAEIGERKVEADQYEFYKKWYYTAVREILAISAFRNEYTTLASQTIPPIKPSEAKKAVALLERLNFIKKNKKGVYEVTSRFITTGDDWRSIAIRGFQEETIRLAARAIEKIPKEERDISTVSITLSSKGFEKVKESLEKFRRELLEISHGDDDRDSAYNINLQLFPIAKKTGGRI